MKKIFSLILILAIGLMAHAQVYVNVTESNQQESAILQIDSEAKGISFPHVSLINTTDIEPFSTTPAEGLLVYNPNFTPAISPGYYYWTNTPSPHWEKVGGINEKGTIIQKIDTEFLGYNPTGAGANAPNTFNVDGATATKQRCVRWDIHDGGNGHVYCSYTLATSQTKDFQSTFNAIKNINGYMVTIVSDAEWNFVKNNVIHDGKNLGEANLTSGIWIGYVKLTTPGNNTPKFYWITHESWEYNWSNNSTVQHQFENGQPAGTTPADSPRCSFIQPASSSPNRLWSSKDCSNASNMSNIIVEFNQ